MINCMTIVHLGGPQWTTMRDRSQSTGISVLVMAP
jgi:hypothetical protein